MILLSFVIAAAIALVAAEDFVFDRALLDKYTQRKEEPETPKPRQQTRLFYESKLPQDRARETKKVHRPYKIHLCSFSPMHHATMRDMFFDKAKAAGYFDTMNVFDQHSLTTVDYRMIEVDNKYRLGPKIAIPYVILESMKRASEGDIVVYASITSKFNKNAHASEAFEVFVQTVQNTSTHRVGFSNFDHPESRFTKGDVLGLFGMLGDEDALMGDQLSSDLIMMGVTNENVDALRTLCDIIKHNDYAYVHQTSFVEENEDDFYRHNDVTSVMSCFFKRIGIFIFEKADDMYFPITQHAYYQ